MNITYFDALSRGWDRMKKALFQPFDLGKWFVVGFTAFLAALLDGPGGGGGGKRWDHSPNFDEFAEFPALAKDWLGSHPAWAGLILFGILFLIVLIVVFAWLSSRGKFLFLHNVVHDKAEVTKPWHEYRRQGDSLFLWRLVYGVIVFAAFILMFFFFFGLIVKMIHHDITGAQKVYTIFGMVLLFLTLFIITSYISLFLNDFVVPVMFKYKISATKGWGKFLPLMSRHFGYFLLYGIIIFLLIIFIIFCVVLFGLVTCCIGFLLLIIPYIGSIVLLPISYTMRSFSVEFLAQFGPDFDVFPSADTTGEIETA